MLDIKIIRENPEGVKAALKTRNADFDAKIVVPVLAALRDRNVNFAVLPDHPVPVKLRQHTTTPVPLAICGKNIQPDEIGSFSEQLAPTGKLGLLCKEELVRKLLEL